MADSLRILASRLAIDAHRDAVSDFEKPIEGQVDDLLVSLHELCLVEGIDLGERMRRLLFPSGEPVGSVGRVLEILGDTPRDRDRFPGQSGVHAGIALLAVRTGTGVVSVGNGEVFGPQLRTLAASFSEADVAELAAMGWHENDGSVSKMV